MDLAAPIHSRVLLGSLITLSAFLLMALGSSVAARSAAPTLIAPAADSAVGEDKARAAYAKLPLAFVPNAGQTAALVRYSAQTSGATFYFTQKEAVFSFAKGKKKGAILRLAFLGANPAPRLEGRQPGTGRVNYLLGNDPAQWHTNLPTYGEVVYRELWPGVDMIFRGGAGRLKYEFRLRPGAKAADIRLAYRGARSLSVSRAGALEIATPLGVLRDQPPQSYQLRQGRRVSVASRYVPQGGTRYSFAVGGYDRARPLVIDPGLIYSTYLGGSADERQGSGLGFAVDSAGNAYVTMGTASADFPTTSGAFDTTHNGAVNDVFVSKLNPAGSALVYSTFLGGSAGESARSIAVDPAGNAYLTGQTTSPNFPVTPGAFDTTYNGGLDAFVTKLNPSGSALAYSTFLGGGPVRDFGFGIAVDMNGNAYVTGDTASPNFPTTPGAFDTTFNGGFGDAFVTKLNPAGSALVYSTFLGGALGPFGFEGGLRIAVDSARNAYVVGGTDSTDFPTTPGAFDQTFNGSGDVFATKLNAAGSALVYSTFLGGTADESGDSMIANAGIALDSDRSVYVSGGTDSPDFPTTPGAYDTTFGGPYDGFVTKLNAAGSALVYSTFLGGSAVDAARGIALDSAGNAHVTGSTNSVDFPTTSSALDPTWNGSDDAFVTKLTATGSALVYSTFLGGTLDDDGLGIGLDAARHVYVNGMTTSPDYPTTSGAFDTTYNGLTDAFVTKLDLACPDDDEDDDGLTDERELLFLTLLGTLDSDGDGVADGNEDSDGDGEDDEDEDDDEDECPNDSDGDGEDDEDEDDDEDDD